MPQRTQAVASPGGTYPLSSVEVARIGYGAMQLRNLAADPAKAEAVLKRAIELGVNHIDTAEFYGDGVVNRMIQQAIPSGAGIVIATKVGATHNPNAKTPIRLAQRPHELRASVEENLKSLEMESLPLVNLRRPDTGPGIRAEGDQIVSLDEQMAELITLREEGKVQAIGLSAVTLQGLQQAFPAGIACVQNAYSLVSREDEELLLFCCEHNIAWVPFFPLGGAFPGWPKVTEQAAVQAIAERYSVTASQVGLAWLLRHKPNILLIPGTANVAHLEENLRAAEIVLADEDLVNLNTLAPAVGSHAE